MGVRSELGRGSVFHAVLPRKIPRGTGWRLPAHEELRPAAVQKHGTVLVVDDDPSSCKLMAAALGQIGYRAECIIDPQAALLWAENFAPAAVVLDLVMPGLDGYAFLDRLRGRPATRETPVLVWSVKDLDPADAARLKSAQAVVQKGQGTAALLDHLRHLLVR